MVILIEGWKNITLQLQQYVYLFMFTPDWKKKDEEHAEWDRRRRSSQEQVSETRDRDEALYICLDIPTLLANFWHATSTSFTFWCL